jgi:hypothetical protein
VCQSPVQLCTHRSERARVTSASASHATCGTTLIHRLPLSLLPSNMCVPHGMRQSMAAFRASPHRLPREDAHAAGTPRSSSGSHRSAALSQTAASCQDGMARVSSIPLPPIVHNPRLHPPQVYHTCCSRTYHVHNHACMHAHTNTRNSFPPSPPPPPLSHTHTSTATACTARTWSAIWRRRSGTRTT